MKTGGCAVTSAECDLRKREAGEALDVRELAGKDKMADEPPAPSPDSLLTSGKSRAATTAIQAL